MRTAEEVEDYEIDARGRALSTPAGDPDGREVRVEIKLFDSCIPRDFLFMKREAITHNVEAFERYVLPFCEKARDAYKHGYGLLFLGENGTGKTSFISWILRHVCAETKHNAFYTTALEIDHLYTHRNRDIVHRLDEVLERDFVAIDELGKERFREGDSKARLHVERILKMRFDEQLPTLLATNANVEELEGAFGKSLMSIIEGKYEVVEMKPGDFRKTLGERMRKTMGYAGGR